MDYRILLLVVLCAVGGIIAWQLFIVAAVVSGLGLVLGAVSPYLLDELAAYMRWRMFSWDAVLSDESFEAGSDSEMMSKPRKVKA